MAQDGEDQSIGGGMATPHFPYGPADSPIDAATMRHPGSVGDGNAVVAVRVWTLPETQLFPRMVSPQYEQLQRKREKIPTIVSGAIFAAVGFAITVTFSQFTSSPWLGLAAATGFGAFVGVMVGWRVAMWYVLWLVGAVGAIVAVKSALFVMASAM